MARCQSWSEAVPPLAVLGNHRDANTFQPVLKFPGLIHVSSVIAPAVRAVLAGKTAASPVPSKERLAPVASLVRAALPKKVDVAVDVAGLTLFQPVGVVAASDEVLLASRFKTKLLVTIAAFAGAGMSRYVKPDASSATSATKEVPLCRISRTLRSTLANI